MGTYRIAPSEWDSLRRDPSGALQSSALKTLVAIPVYAGVPYTLRSDRGSKRQLLDEKKVGLIPKIVVPGRLGPREFAVLVTDKRSIFALESSSKAGVGAAFGVIGAVVAAAATSRRTFDYEQIDPDLLATDPKNFVISHDSLERLELKKGLLGPIFRFNIEYRTAEGKGKKVKGQLVPPSALWKQKKQEGLGRKAIHYDYAKKVQDLYQRALPTAASAQLAAWKL